ncbi:MAG: hypothetical protein A2527_13270 [Candidatus Lambdaproteobacteria bacterium RIFOXYD2_FULL_50_16]|uniref:Chemotaxis protein CheA n=1 Tax=Candidatus Lambdaproteobacteria bacterium RIFOXYD2_FULL_50_16 TaxID=1817772 RepID=A0A1F6GG95_9PROT|nr:MAG: hypothetical protein A2527_13270 [Candidatus Lambdaproteobacteria bacterium RIFOXYD2_FULL_50_16]
MKRLWVLMMLYAWLGFSPLEAEPLVLERQAQDLGPSLQYWVDPSNQATIDQVASSSGLARFEPNQRPVLSLGYADGAVWVRLPVLNRGQGPIWRVLEQGFPVIDQVEFYQQVQGSWSKRLAGDLLPFNQREYQVPAQTFLVEFPPGETELFLRVTSRTPINLPLRLVPPEHFLEGLMPDLVLTSLFAGLVLVMFVYHIVLYFGVRDITYLTYCFFILSIGLYIIVYKGYAYQYLWPESPLLNNLGPPITVSLSIFWGIFFTKTYLHTKNYTPYWNRFLNFYLFPALAAPIASLLPGYWQEYVLSILALIIAPVPIILGIRISLKKYQPALFFLIALGGSMASVLVATLRGLGYLDFNYFTENAMILGNIWEIVILSFALSYRIRGLLQERMLAQAELLKSARREKALVEENNATLELKVTQRTAEIRELLDNTGQGFLSFNSDYKIGSQYSKTCEQFFGEPIGGLDALKLLFGEEAQEHQKVTDTIFMTRGKTYDLIDFLPKEITRGSYVLELTYKLVLHPPPEKDRLLLMLTDVTRERTLKAMLEADDATARMILAVARDRDGFLMALEEARDLLSLIKEELESPTEGGGQLMLRCFHTLKGEMACYGLIEVAALAHELEDKLVGKDKVSLEEAEDLTVEALGLENALLDGEKKLKEMVGLEELDEGGSRRLRVPTQRLDHLISLLKAGRRFGRPEWEQALEDLKNQPLLPYFKKLSIEAERLAERLNKKVSVQIESGGIDADQIRLAGLLASLVHLVRNALDHGIETPATRRSLGKPETGRLEIGAEKNEQRLLIWIADDGQGIDAELMARLAVVRGLLSPEEAAKLSPKQAQELIFRPGFSTSDKVTLTSGRGVGMDAVKNAARALGGEVTLTSHLGQGSRIEITLPHRPPSPLWQETSLTLHSASA